jgi:NAD+ kinase
VSGGPRVAVLAKRTSYRMALDNKDALVKRLLARGDASVRKLRNSHDDHEATMREVRAALDRVGAVTTFHDGPRSRIEEPCDLVLTVGGDGTLLSASHQIGPDVPLLGVNSAPESSVGFFCAARKGRVLETLQKALDGTLKRVQLTRMRVDRNGKRLYARVLNEALFCHASPAATSRYILRLEKGDAPVFEEEQRSSGMWIGPAAGSTAAQRSAGGKVLPLASRRLQYVVREPYTPAGERLRHVVGRIDVDERLVLHNKMREAKLFLDGHHTVFEIALGDVLTLQRSDEPLTVLGLRRSRLFER